ncbi:MAG: hypothetical protein H7833_09735 [Magnetococcus sp. DMHC-1]|nr:hypothetical protein [Magnetococcales bacterium]
MRVGRFFLRMILAAALLGTTTSFAEGPPAQKPAKPDRQADGAATAAAEGTARKPAKPNRPSEAEGPAGKPTKTNHPDRSGQAREDRSGGTNDSMDSISMAFADMGERVQAMRMQMAKVRQSESPAEWRQLLREHSETMREVVQQMQELTQGVLNNTETGTAGQAAGHKKSPAGSDAGMTRHQELMERRLALLLNLMEQMVVHVDAVMLGSGGAH